MSDRQRIYILFNQGCGHEKFYEKLRTVFGRDAYFVELQRPGQKIREEHRAAVDEMRVLEGGGLGALRSMAKQARRERVDLFIIFFDSIKLRLFAAAMRPRQCVWWRGDGYVVTLPTTVPRTLLQLARLRARGLLSLARIYSAIYLRRYNVQQ